MLLYHPFSDARHCVFRLLSLLEQNGGKEIEVQRLRIWDFYLLFPQALTLITLPHSGTALKRKLAAKKNRYDVMPDPRRAFIRLEPMQQAAIRYLASKGLIDAVKLQNGKILRTEMALPSELTDLIKARNQEMLPLLTFLTTTFYSLELYGQGGVRNRTNLLDTRYDLS